MNPATAPVAPTIGSAERWKVFGVCVFLAALIGVVFGQTLNHQYVNYDDNVYVYANPIVQPGLTWKGFGWAFTTFEALNWHPLTWLSHMLDCQLYGLAPGPQHLTSVLLHTATAILLFLTLRQMTGRLWRSAFVAAVFAIHPLRVESVAWIAERKDVLSGFFFVLAMAGYAHYVKRPSAARYLLVLLAAALALMSKPMAVTLPWVLLLLDFWPLKRLSADLGRPLLQRLMLEKIPLLALSAADSVMTVLAQNNVIAPIQLLPFPVRIGNALVSYVVYLKQLFYPAGLAVLYPYPMSGLAPWKIIGAAFLLLAISTAAALAWRTRPWCLFGWLFYLGMLAPVIGLIQVGSQAHADRYTYLPEIGLCVALTWLAAEALARWRPGRLALGAAGAMILTALARGAWVQTGYWQNSETLWNHTLACTSNNIVAQNNLGYLLTEENRTGEAITHLREAVRLKPDYLEALNNLGNALNKAGDLDGAVEQYQNVVELAAGDSGVLRGAGVSPAANAQLAAAYNNLGDVLGQKGRLEEAIDRFQQALQCQPGYADAHFNLAYAFIKKGDWNNASIQLKTTLALRPGFADAAYNLAMVQSEMGNLDEAAAALQKLLQAQPDLVDARYNLGSIFFRQGKMEDAIDQFQRVLQVRPNAAAVHYQLASALLHNGSEEQAITEFQQALQIDPNNVPALNALAWELATAPQPAVRNGPRALDLARQASQLTGGTNVIVISTLAAACAETGQFADALQNAQTALKLAQSAGQPAQVKDLARQLQSYQAGQPYHRSGP